jgi:hypothetical protein
MSWIATAVVGSAIIGGAASKSAAKSGAAAQDRATEASLEAFNFSKPYIKRSYDASEGFNQDVLNTGNYQGQTFANTPWQMTRGNAMMASMGNRLMPMGFDMANTGSAFANNYGDLFAQSQADRMGTAQQYALDNSQPLINAAMRDDYRNLTEKTLPGINMGASGSGNMNSSRAGIADAVANRGFNDRQADVTASIQNQLMNQSLGQQNTQFSQAMKANDGLQDAFTQGINAAGTGGDWMTGAGQNLMNLDQQQLNDLRARFEQDRDFAFNQQQKFQQGTLNNAVYDTGNVSPNMWNPGMSTFGGAMQGAGTMLDMIKTFKEL